MTYSAEQAAELRKKVFPNSAWVNSVRDDEELAAIINAALSQQAAPGVAGEEWESLAYALCEEDGQDPHHLIWEGNPPEPWGDAWLRYEHDAKRMIALVRKHASQPHPTGDTQREAVGRIEWYADSHPQRFGAVEESAHAVLNDAGMQLPEGAELFTHPPEATALAQQVRERAMQIVDDLISIRELKKQHIADAWGEIAAIPIPEPRPEHICETPTADALVAMAYRKAAEVAEFSYWEHRGNTKLAKEDAELFKESGATRASNLIRQGILALTPPDAQAALEELCMKVANEAYRKGEYDGRFPDEYNSGKPNAIVRATLNQQKD